MTRVEFFSDNRDTKFVDRVCAYLDISTDRMKIVGATNIDLSTGSALPNRRQLQLKKDNEGLQLVFILDQEYPFGEQPQNEEYDPKADYDALSEQSVKLQKNIH